MENFHKAAAMLKADATVSEEQRFVLSNLPPSPAQKRLAIGIVLGPVHRPVPGYRTVRWSSNWPEVQSFVAVYTTAMFVTDAITAILLFAQFSILRSRAILVIASGYLFTALLIVPYPSRFPACWRRTA